MAVVMFVLYVMLGDGPGLGLGAGYESEEREEDGEVETMWSQQQEHEQGVQSHQSLAQTLIDSGDDNYDPQVCNQDHTRIMDGK